MSVVGLFVAPGAGAPMASLERIAVAEGLGIAGDRYRDHTGHWSDPHWADQQITLVAAETAEALGVEPSALRRNVVTQGVDLDALMGADVRIGTAVLRFVRPCDPCSYLEDLLQRPGLRAALEGRGGVRAAVVESGRITVGDRLALVASGPVRGA